MRCLVCLALCRVCMCIDVSPNDLAHHPAAGSAGLPPSVVMATMGSPAAGSRHSRWRPQRIDCALYIALYIAHTRYFDACLIDISITSSALNEGECLQKKSEFVKGSRCVRGHCA